MPLSKAELEDIQAEFMADDIAIDLDKMSLWTREQAATYFDSGGMKEPVSAPVALGRKPRIAILHGTAANEAIVKIQLAKLLTPLRERCDVFIVEGALTAREESAETQVVRNHFGAKHVLREYARATFDERQWRTYDDLDDSMARVESDIAALSGGGGADVLIGFSQGANLITCLCARGSYRAAVLLAPSNPGWAKQLAGAFAAPLTTPTIVGYSDTDAQVNNSGGCGPANTARLYAPESVTILHHAGPGHRPLPREPADLQRVIDAVMALVEGQCPM